ncbi:MAG: hypothetical protein LBU91_05595 [Bacteroidales bacterium]|jgi:hypothetical protein|nr:hypothetical protein [Bacteroidales bacterium]
MKKHISFLSALILASAVHAQTLILQGGTSVSKLNWNLERISTPNAIHDKALNGHAIFAGIDYLDKPYFNLSSHIGLIRKGGLHDVPFSEQTTADKLTLDYASVNTTINLKYPIDKTYIPFVSIGPRLDYLVGHSEHFDVIADLNELQQVSVGLLLGAGIKMNVKNVQLGLRADYYLNFKPIADWRNQNPGNGGHIRVNTFGVSLSVGYKLL